jgi:hypothetical protein
VGYRQAGIDPAKLYGLVPVAERIRTAAFVVAPGYIAGSDFNLALSGGARILPFEDLNGMFRTTAAVLRREPGPKYLYLYWPRLDTLGHQQGIEAQATVCHLQEIERALTDFLIQTAGTDTLVVATADHGQIDTSSADRLDLADHPTLARALVMPPCGEPRAAFCYLKPGHLDRFTDYCRTRLADHLEVIPSQDLLAQGLFGLGQPNPRLPERIGDLTLLMRGNSVIHEYLPSETPHVQIGAHGGLSRTELLVPLCLMRA